MKRNADGWVPLRQVPVAPLTAKLVTETAAVMGISEDEARASLELEAATSEYFVNDVYQVTRAPTEVGRGWPAMIHLNVRRRDGKVIFRDWRQFQRIKNELVGPENEAVELYPGESRRVDTGNKYHLWVLADPKLRFPFGFGDRDVLEHDANHRGLRQRPGDPA